MSEGTFPWDKFIKKPSGVKKTPLVYYGGKTRAADFVIRHFPPHKVFVDVFGGGGGISFAKNPSEVDVYNDIGNVSNFFQCLRDNANGLYKALYFTPYSREEFYRCTKEWHNLIGSEDRIEWARMWYVQIMQSFKHQEDDDSWLVSKGVNSAQAFANHVDDLPVLVDRLRGMIIENKDFADIFAVYDGKDTLFYCDPPYVAESRSTMGDYRNEMDEARHKELLYIADNARGQVVISGYPSDLYDGILHPPRWRRAEKTRRSGIHNSTQEVGTRTEVVWCKEHAHGLWGSNEQGQSSANLARVREKEAIFKRVSFLNGRKVNQ